MKKLFSQLILIFVPTFLMMLSFASHCQAQSLGSVTRVSTVPAGLHFRVDGTDYGQSTSFIWPAGSKHTLIIDTLVQDQFQLGTKSTFNDWEWAGGTLPGNPVVVTADPSITEYKAVFTVEYALFVSFYSCDGASCPNGPGTVYVNGTATTSSQTFYEPPGQVVLQAFPGNGWIFAGWNPGPSQTIQGFQDTINLTGPLTVYARFQVARSINLSTLPAGLSIMADRTPVPTPSTLQWGWDSSHTVGPVTPQQDNHGQYWVFSSWSDNGDPIHAYTVGEMVTPASLTATYVPAAVTTLMTQPQGLSLTVDGRSNWPSYNFTWGVGENHVVSAPAQQTDAQGRIWAFSDWSNGGAATQTYTVPADAVSSGVRLTAVYKPVAHVIVNSSVSGLVVTVDGTPCGTPCDIQRTAPAQVHIGAPASVPQGTGSRADFLAWSDGTVGDWVSTLTGNDPVNLSANYHVMNILAATANPSGGALFQLQPASPDGYYDAGSTVSVTAKPQSGYKFRAWAGDLGGSSPSGSLAMSSPRSVQALLDPTPYLSPTGIVNGAGTTPQAGVAPGSVVSLFGSNLASATAVAPDGQLPQTLAGVTVHINDRLLPLFFVSPGQINLQLPADLEPGQATLAVSQPGQPDVQAPFNIVQDAPGLFAQTVNGQLFALAYHQDGSSVTTDSPAQRGELLTVYGTGFGPTSPVRPFGLPVPQSPVYAVQDAATVQVGDATLNVENAFAVPGHVGIDAVQFRLADGAPTGTNAGLSLTVNGQVSNIVLLPAQ
jgi:uncharacterized protein (TIGR03437 family)